MNTLIESLESRTLYSASADIPLTPDASTAATFIKPTAKNTGYSGDLKNQKGYLTITKPNTVLDHLLIKGPVYIKANNVTISNCKINGLDETYAIQVISGSVTVQDSAIVNASGAGIYGNNWTLLRDNIHDMGSDAAKGGGHNTMIGCFIHNIGTAPGAHADGLQIDNGDTILIQGNNFDLPYWDQGKDGTIYRANSCIFLNGYVNDYLDGTIIDHNWITGGNYSIFALNQTHTQITSNIFGDDYQYGYLTGKVSTFTGNFDTHGNAI